MKKKILCTYLATDKFFFPPCILTICILIMQSALILKFDFNVCVNLTKIICISCTYKTCKTSSNTILVKRNWKQINNVVVFRKRIGLISILIEKIRFVSLRYRPSLILSLRANSILAFCKYILIGEGREKSFSICTRWQKFDSRECEKVEKRSFSACKQKREIN